MFNVSKLTRLFLFILFCSLHFSSSILLNRRMPQNFTLHISCLLYILLKNNTVPFQPPISPRLGFVFLFSPQQFSHFLPGPAQSAASRPKKMYKKKTEKIKQNNHKRCRAAAAAAAYEYEPRNAMRQQLTGLIHAAPSSGRGGCILGHAARQKGWLASFERRRHCGKASK